MHKKIKLLYGLVTLIIVVTSLFFGIAIKKTWKNDLLFIPSSDYKNYTVNFDELFENEAKTPAQIQNFNTLYKDADVIVRVNIGKNTKHHKTYQSSYVEGKVKEIYKGKVIEDKIKIVESIFIANKHLSGAEGSLFFNNGEDYIVFLRKYPGDMYGKYDNTYVLTTGSISKYHVTNDTVDGKCFLMTQKQSDNSSLKYKELKKYDSFTLDPNVVEFYDSNKKNINDILKKV